MGITVDKLIKEQGKAEQSAEDKAKQERQELINTKTVEVAKVILTQGFTVGEIRHILQSVQGVIEMVNIKVSFPETKAE